jgi:hypothetical protein
MKKPESTTPSRGVIVLRNLNTGERRIVVTDKPLDSKRQNDQVVRLPDGNRLVVPRRAIIRQK